MLGKGETVSTSHTFFSFKFSNSSLRRINVGNVSFTLSVFSMVLYIVFQAVLCAISQFQILCLHWVTGLRY